MIPLPPTRIVLVDDHALYRLGLRTTISEMDASITIIGECGSSSEFTLMLQQKRIPDLVILDIRLPAESGLYYAVLRSFRRNSERAARNRCGGLFE